MIRLRALGQSDLALGEDGDVNALLSQPKRFALLCYLAIPKPGVMYRRDAILGVFWPEDAEQPRVALRQALTHLRKVLGPDVITRRGSQEVGLNPDMFWCDVAEFEAALNAHDWSAAVGSYHGELLHGFHLSHDPEWERWLDGERARLARRYAAALEELARIDSTAGNTQAAVEWWQRLVQHDPYDSRYRMCLMEALELAGDPGNALREGLRHREFLLQNLDIAPPPEFEALVERMRSEHGPTGGPSGFRRRRSDRLQPVDTPDDSSSDQSVESAEAQTDVRSIPHPDIVRHGRLWLFSAVTAIVAITLAILGSYLMIPQELEVRLNPDHVVVATFRNATGEPSLDLLGERTGHWITEGLQHAAVPVTPWDIAQQAWQHVQEQAQAGEVDNLVRALGEETGAGTVISGAIYLEGERLEIHVDVNDAWRGRSLGSPPPMIGSLHDQRELIGEVQQQAMVYLAATFDDRLEGLTPDFMSKAPSFDAYQEFVRGLEHHMEREYRDAIGHYKRAIELDSTWAQPAIRMRAAVAEVGTEAENDSVMMLFDRLWDRLSEYEKAVVQSFRAQNAGERETFLDALRREAELAPGSPSVNNLGVHLNRQNRPEEALGVMLQVDLERGWWRQWPPRWDILADAHHMLGEYREELEIAHRCRRLHPEYERCLEFQGRALAALGRTDELHELMVRPRKFDELLFIRAVMMPAIETLRAYGYGGESLQIAEDVVELLEDRHDFERRRIDHRLLYAKALFLAGKSDESQDLYDILVAEYPDRIDIRTARAFVAGARGDYDRAGDDFEWLGHYNGSEWADDEVLWFRGVVAGALGRLEQAAGLLSEADRGYEATDRIGMFYEPLRDYPPFQEWLRPRG